VATNLLLGLFFMRDLIRRMDGEKDARPETTEIKV
jgi:hypothetical protein